MPDIVHARHSRNTGRLAIWVTLIIGWLILTHLPKLPSGPVRIPHLDKLVHFSSFCILSLVGLWANAWRRYDKRSIMLWLGAFAVFALADESTQPLVNRSFEWLDWLADLIGATLAMFVWRSITSTRHPSDTVT